MARLAAGWTNGPARPPEGATIILPGPGGTSPRRGYANDNTDADIRLLRERRVHVPNERASTDARRPTRRDRRRHRTLAVRCGRRARRPGGRRGPVERHDRAPVRRDATASRAPADQQHEARWRRRARDGRPRDTPSARSLRRPDRDHARSPPGRWSTPSRPRTSRTSRWAGATAWTWPRSGGWCRSCATSASTSSMRTCSARTSGAPCSAASRACRSWSPTSTRGPMRASRMRRFLDGHVTGRLADAFVAVSERDRERMIALEGVPPEKTSCCPNPYIPREASGRVDLRAELGIAAGHAASSGRRRPAPARRRSRYSSRRSPTVRRHARRPARRSPATGRAGAARGAGRRAGDRPTRCISSGWWEDVAGVLDAPTWRRSARTARARRCSPSSASAHRTPLVSTDVGNVADVLGRGKGVVLVPRRDPRRLAAALEALLRDPARRAAQAAAAAVRFERYEIDTRGRRVRRPLRGPVPPARGRVARGMTGTASSSRSW